eukprot:4103787-Lingulodinium_polyedra.AAC.1
MPTGAPLRRRGLQHIHVAIWNGAAQAQDGGHGSCRRRRAMRARTWGRAPIQWTSDMAAEPRSIG